MSNDINSLQLGIDVGRVLSPTIGHKTLDELRIDAQKIIDVIGVPLGINDEPRSIIGLGYGISNRRRLPLDEDAMEIIGQPENGNEGLV